MNPLHPIIRTTAKIDLVMLPISKRMIQNYDFWNTILGDELLW